MHVTVWHHYGIHSVDSIFIAEDVVPGTDRGVAFTNVDVTGLAVEVAVFTVGHLYHIGCPHHFGGRPVHDDVFPVDEVLARPHLGGAVSVACSVGGGI